MYISDNILTKLAALDYDAARGEFSAEARATLATALPEICAELLRWRQAAANTPYSLALALRSAAIEADVTKARQTIRAQSPLPDDLINACETLLRHSSNAPERAAAEFVLAETQEAA